MFFTEVCAVLFLCAGGWGLVSCSLGGCLCHVTVMVLITAGREGALAPAVQLVSTPRAAAHDTSVTVSLGGGTLVWGALAVCCGCTVLWVLCCLSGFLLVFSCVDVATVWRFFSWSSFAVLDMHR